MHHPLDVDRVLSLAREAVTPTSRVVAIAKAGNEMYVGKNDFLKTHPRAQRKYDNGHEVFTRHAEMHVLQQMAWVEGRKVRLYVVRFDAQNRLSMSKPCRWCQQHLADKNVRPRNVYYINWLGQWANLSEWNFSVPKEFCPQHSRLVAA